MRRILLTLALIALTGCHTTAALTSKTYDPKDNPRPTGVVYHFPKTLLRIAITYTVTDEIKYTSGVPGPLARSVTITKPVTITAVLGPDTTRALLIETTDVAERGLLASTLDLKLDDLGNLSAVDTEITDKSAVVAQNLVGALVSLAKIAAVAGDDLPPDLRAIQERIRDNFSTIAMLSRAKKLDTKRIKAFQEEIALLKSLVTEYREANRTEKTTREVSYTMLLDPDEFKSSEDQKYHEHVIQPGNLIERVTEQEMPVVTVRLALTKHARDLAVANSTKALAVAADGVFYRTPAPILTTLLIQSVDPNQAGTDVAVAREYLAYPQFGAVGIAPVRAKRFAAQTTAITVSPTTGALKTYKVTGGSSAEGASTAVASALSTVQQSLIDIRYGQEIAMLGKEKELRDAKKALEVSPAPSEEDQRLAELRKQKELLDAEIALAKAKKELEDFNKPVP